MLPAVEKVEQEAANVLSHSRQRTPGLFLAALVCGAADHMRGGWNDCPVGITARSGGPVWDAAEDQSPGLDPARARR